MTSQQEKNEINFSQDLFTRLYLAVGLSALEAEVAAREDSLQMLKDAVGYITDDMTDSTAADQIRQAADNCATQEAVTELMADRFEINQIQEGVTQAMAANLLAWKENLPKLNPDQAGKVMDIFQELGTTNQPTTNQ